jgi:serine/threonine-protein kinase RsbW
LPAQDCANPIDKLGILASIQLVTPMDNEPSDIYEFESKELILRLDVTFAATVSAIAPIVERILSLAKESSCVAGKEFEVQLALYEAITNAIIHGAKEDATKMVEVSACCDQSRGMLIVVRDPGQGFEADAIPSPIQGERIFASHGRGIFLINQIMDKVDFKRGGTEIRMLKR